MSTTQAPKWNYIVVGGGLAGSVSAAALGRSGASVLVLELGGTPIPTPTSRRSFLAKVKNKLVPSAENISVGRMRQFVTAKITSRKGTTKTNRFPAVLGTGLGGSSQLYSAALGRFRPSDFEQDTSSSRGGIDNSWPFGWSEIKPYYDQAEQLMGVSGTPDETDPTDTGEYLQNPPALGPADTAMMDRLKQNGRHPFRLHVGFEYRPGCSECLGSICQRGCKATGLSRALAPAMKDNIVDVRTEVEALEIIKIDGNLQVKIRNESGDTEVLSADHIIVAAGALKTPAILLSSKTLWNTRPAPVALGKGLMFHLSDVFAVRNPSTPDRYGPQKTIGIRDHYDEDGTPLGEVQSFGIPVQTGLVANHLIEEARRKGFGFLGPFLLLARLPAAFAARRYGRATLFATILEDMPFLHNKVILGANSDQIHFEYHIDEDVYQRNGRLRDHIKTAFAPFKVNFFSSPGTPNWGHPCGTARMGKNPETAATTPQGQLWGHDDISIVDASVFPSSGGANPSLTIVANALRVVEGLVER